MFRFSKVQIGSDPELFIVNTKTDKVVSAIGLIPGKKKDAYRPAGMHKGYGVQIDNILAEFNIPPVRSANDFIHHINYMKDYIRNYVKEKNPDLDIRCVGSQHVPYDQLVGEEACQFGCDPDYNAYTEDVNPKPCGETTDLRSAGVHIHVSYDNPNVIQSIHLVKCMDLFLGVPSVLLDPDKERRQLYGKAGSFRLVNYGVEYRTMSGYFISSNEMIKFLFEQTMKAINWASAGMPLPDPDVIQKTINENDVNRAKTIVESFKIM